MQLPAVWVKHREEPRSGSEPLGTENMESLIPQQDLEKRHALGEHIYLGLEGEMLQEGRSGASKAQAQGNGPVAQV